MEIVGLEFIAQDLESDGFFFKCVFNQNAAVFFPGSVQHRDIKQAGVSYEDNYGGNALAATITASRIDIRFHQDYADETVSAIFSSILRQPSMEWARSYSIFYQGRQLDFN